MSMESPQYIIEQLVEHGIENEEQAYNILNDMYGPLPPLGELKKMSTKEYFDLATKNLLSQEKPKKIEKGPASVEDLLKALKLKH
jgi:hypothetical protein